jgi:hypothetical protein
MPLSRPLTCSVGTRDIGKRHVKGLLMNRREFLQGIGVGVPCVLLSNLGVCATQGGGLSGDKAEFLKAWAVPPREFSQAPFWFWNDRLSKAEIARQLDDFVAHGVYGFVIHPRAGLPRDIGWMSDTMIDFMRFAIEGAAERDMWVVLYDEGMYPSGSSCGQVVQENPAFRTRGLFCIDLDEAEHPSVTQGIRINDAGEPVLASGQTLVATVKRRSNGHRLAIVDRAMRSGRGVIRGLHFREEDPGRRADHREVPEDAPPGADILNPESVACFIRLVYQRFYDEFGTHFGKTIKGVFTDEPSMLARGGERGAKAGTTGILEHVSAWLGYDFTPHLPALWHGDEPEADRVRADYDRALQARLETTFYAPISKWCGEHGVALAGHPAAPDDIGHLRHFHMPGQDIVWRYIEPGKASALEGAQSTQAKCASSAMIHLGRRRNSNEFCGAYGHNFTFKEMKWLTHWLCVRGCNLLYPHAFYYSIRGPRVDERPPDVGPNSPWWGQYKPYADACSRLCWLNTDSTHVCSLAILGLNDHLPWRASKVCFEHQRDFNYLEARHLWEDAQVDAQGVRLAGMHYQAILIDSDIPARAEPAIELLKQAGRVIDCRPGMDEATLVRRIDAVIPPDVTVSPAAPGLRVRHVVKSGLHCYLLFNEGEDVVHVDLKLSVKGQWYELDSQTGQCTASATRSTVTLAPHAHRTLLVTRAL